VVEVKRRLAGETVDIYQRLIERKLNFFVHVYRMNNKTIVFGVMESPNKPGRPRKEWLSDVIEWCNNDTVPSEQHRTEKWAAIVKTLVDTGHANGIGRLKMRELKMQHGQKKAGMETREWSYMESR